MGSDLQRMQLFGLQLESSCLQLSFFAHRCFGELSCLLLDILLTTEASLLTFEALFAYIGRACGRARGRALERTESSEAQL